MMRDRKSWMAVTSTAMTMRAGREAADGAAVFLVLKGAMASPHPSWPGLSRQSTPLPRRNSRVSFETVRGGWIYIMTNRPNGTLYTGVTNNIALRAYEHRQGLIEGFTRCYGLKRLVLTEFY
jgi:GIY-YIG catalytic domain